MSASENVIKELYEMMKEAYHQVSSDHEKAWEEAKKKFEEYKVQNPFMWLVRNKIIILNKFF